MPRERLFAPGANVLEAVTSHEEVEEDGPPPRVKPVVNPRDPNSPM